MSETEAVTVNLPTNLVTKVRARVATGEFSDVSELVCRSLDSYIPESGQPVGMSDAEFTELLRREVLPVLDALDADPSSGLTPEQVRVHLAERRAR